MFRNCARPFFQAPPPRVALLSRVGIRCPRCWRARIPVPKLGLRYAISASIASLGRTPMLPLAHADALSMNGERSTESLAFPTDPPPRLLRRGRSIAGIWSDVFTLWRLNSYDNFFALRRSLLDGGPPGDGGPGMFNVDLAIESSRLRRAAGSPAEWRRVLEDLEQRVDCPVRRLSTYAVVRPRRADDASPPKRHSSIHQTRDPRRRGGPRNREMLGKDTRLNGVCELRLGGWAPEPPRSGPTFLIAR